MRLRNKVLSALLVSVVALTPGLALAQAGQVAPVTPRPQVNINVQADAPLPAEQEAHAAYAAAMGAAGTGGWPAVQAHVPALTALMGNAPATYPVMEETAEGWAIRADSRDEIMALARHIGDIEGARGGGDIRIIARPNVYPRIAFLLGSAAVERREFDEAHAVLDQGLALQPLDRYLLNEKLVALHAQRRWDEAYELAQGALTSGDPLIEAHPGSLQRRLGYTLIELGRLPEARAAYEASLVSEPDNATAIAELEIIRDLEAGHSLDGEVRIVSPNMAAPAAPAND
ncbi:tetratricopeptide repeat protein [Brevundimonas sp. FT23042]|uniref:tetratricopeptide repeat protein n=1 Tax=Brevundimonas sp. FT23042 TaxID=3393749 RepID=UPI003B58686A